MLTFYRDLTNFLEVCKWFKFSSGSPPLNTMINNIRPNITSAQKISENDDCFAKKTMYRQNKTTVIFLSYIAE